MEIYWKNESTNMTQASNPQAAGVGGGEPVLFYNPHKYWAQHLASVLGVTKNRRFPALSRTKSVQTVRGDAASRGEIVGKGTCGGRTGARRGGWWRHKTRKRRQKS